MSEEGLDAVRHALTVARSKGFRSVELEADGLEFSATLAEVVEHPSAEGVAAPVADSEPETHTILAEAVGYLSWSDGTPGPGEPVVEGQTVATIEALGIANEVVATVGGTVVDAHVAEGDPVEFGQPLLKIGDLA